jgi:alkaline phosphatase D
MQRLFSFLIIAVITFQACQSVQEQSQSKLFTEEVSVLYDSTLWPFYHGVASGDPLTDRVIIWTRVTPQDSVQNIDVKWEVSQDQNFSVIVKTDFASATSEKDYTVKVDVTGLSAGTSYYYRFTALGETSPAGKTKTLPNHADNLKVAVVSCSNWEFGYFNAYERIAEKPVDVVLHLGDYIYEYGVGSYGDTTIHRTHLPAHEIITLQDYRTRYSQYHLDQGLRKLRQTHPFITIWDDHEVANNVYTEGAQNHQADKEGAFEARKAAARQAYYEWIPIREDSKHYRSFSFGNLADVIMLDERLEGRTKPADSITDPILNESNHSMLGAEQLSWFKDELKNSKATWKIIGNQVMFSDLDQSASYPDNPKNLDSWDGYPQEKKEIAGLITSNNLKNIIFLTGDTHSSWAFEVKTSQLKNNNKAFAIELGTTSVSSSNWNEYTSDDTVKMGEQLYLRDNPHLKYVNQRDHGYLLLTLHADQAKAEWFYVETLRNINNKEMLGKVLTVTKDQPSLH